MQVLHYADEVRAFDEVPVGDAALRDAEMKLAVQLIEQISTDEFHPENYQDEVRARYNEAIQRKVEGQEVTAAAPEQPRGQIIDLMEALKASLAAKGGRAREGRPSRPAGRRKRRRSKPARAAAAKAAPRRDARKRGPRPPPAAAANPASLSALRDSLARVAREVVACERCPRLRAWCREVAQVKVRRFRGPGVLGPPGPGCGDPRARLLIVGLAPAAHGGNRTGRIFTGDRSGDFLFAGLHRAGFASQPTSVARGDGLELRDCYVAAVARCAPPANKPLPEEIGRCREYLSREWRLLAAAAVLVLGRIAQDGLLAMLRSIGRVPPRQALRVRARRRARPGRRRAAVRLLPPVAAEHVHGKADPGRPRAGVGAHPRPPRKTLQPPNVITSLAMANSAA